MLIRREGSCSEEPDTPFFLAARSAVPLQQEFKPALKVLARKPAPKAVRTIDPVTGLARMTIEDDDEEEVVRRDLPTAEELRAQREEKQRRYNEARARILGPTPGTGTGTGPVVSPGEEGRGRGGGNGNGNGSGNGNGNTRGRGGRGAARQAGQESARPGSQGASGSGSGAGGKDLYDPNYTPKPTTIQKRPGSGRSTPKDEDQIIRAPRGPDGSNRGFGFARRGGRTS